MKNNRIYTRDENRCIKADVSRRCHVAGPTLLSTERRCQLLFHAPLSPLSNVALSSPFSRSRPVCLFLLADGCPYFSLYPLRTQSPSRLETRFLSPLPFSSIQLFISSSLIFFSLYVFFRFFLLSFSFCLPTSPPSDTAVPSLPRTDAATRCNVIFIVFFFFLSSHLLPRFLLYFSRSVFLAFIQYQTHLQSLDKSRSWRTRLSMTRSVSFSLSFRIYVGSMLFVVWT